MGKTYTVTGAGGWLGSSFVETICTHNIDQVTKLKLFDLTFKSEVRQVQAKHCAEANISVEWIEGDVTDYKVVLSAVQGSNVVIHMASVIDLFEKMPRQTVWNINVGGTVNMLKACCEANVKYMIYTSSIHVLGPNSSGEHLINGDEETPYRTDLPHLYANTKREAEKKVSEANGSKTVDGEFLTTCSLRPTGMYGENDPVLEVLIGSKAKSKIFHAPMKASDKQSRMYLFNAAWCHVLAAKEMQIKSDLIGGNAYFLGDETPKKSYTRLNLDFCVHRGFKIGKREPIAPRSILLLLLAIVNLVSRILVKFGVTLLQDVPTPSMVGDAIVHFTVTHRKFEKHFGYVPLYSWEESKERTRTWVDQLLERKSKEV